MIDSNLDNEECQQLLPGSVRRWVRGRYAWVARVGGVT
jgi:hypothetical protein